MFDILQDIESMTVKLLKRFGYVTKDGEITDVAVPSSDSDVNALHEDECVGDSLKKVFKIRDPKDVRRQRSRQKTTNNAKIDPEVMTAKGYCIVHLRWFSLHAGVHIEGDDRDGLRKLIRYTSRPAVHPSQLSFVNPLNPNRSDIKLHIKRSWQHGTTDLVFSHRTFTPPAAVIS